MKHRTPLSDTGAVRVTQTKSGIGTTNTLPDRPEIRGMIARVPHLVTVEAGALDAVVPSRRKTPVRAPDPLILEPAEDSA